MTISKKLFIAQTVLLTLAVGYLGSVAVTSSARIHALESAGGPQLVSAHDQRDGFHLTDAQDEVASVEITVPEGMTRATVTVTGVISLLNRRDNGFGVMRSYVEVGDRGQVAQFTPIEAWRYQTTNFARTEIFEDLEPGQTIVIRANAAYPFPSDNTTANLTATAIFLP